MIDSQDGSPTKVRSPDKKDQDQQRETIGTQGDNMFIQD